MGQRHVCTFRHVQRAAYRTAISAARILVIVINCWLQSYLCTAYYVTMVESYTIKWTTPHCVLTLRLIGLVWDVYDGRVKPVGVFTYLFYLFISP